MVACRPLPGDATTAQAPSPPPRAYVRNGRTPAQPKETRRKVPYGTADWPGCRPAERRREAAQAKSPAPLFRSESPVEKRASERGECARSRPGQSEHERCRKQPRPNKRGAAQASRSDSSESKGPSGESSSPSEQVHAPELTSSCLPAGIADPTPPRRPAYLDLPRCRHLPSDKARAAGAANAARPPFARSAAPTSAQQREETPAQFVRPAARRGPAWATIPSLEERARARKAEQEWQGWFTELEKRPERC